MWRPPPCRRLVRATMAFTIRPVEYFYATVRDELGAAYHVLSALAERGVDLFAFTAVPSGPTLAQFALFPQDPLTLAAEARTAGLAPRRRASAGPEGTARAVRASAHSARP